jgi:rubrerythrin
MEKINKMNTRFNQILNSIKSAVLNKHKITASYEYQCRKCGLILDFNRNQPNVKCPNDGSTMYRI